METLDNIILIVLVIIAIFIAVMIVALPIYFLHLWLTKKGLRYLSLVSISILLIWTFYSIYTAVYPTDSFYLNEFSEVTLRQPPTSAEVIRKEASYPDFHGDYCSVSLIKLSKHDYKNLLKELSEDKRMKKNQELTGSSVLDKAMGDIKTSQIITNFTREGKAYWYIGFLDDFQTILVYVSYT